ncbi:MAG: octaprenyl diphosphate synthase [Gammaproteobacteria bacterium]|nr:MAG: octaprenyl diphosphate synthase [Gammaproteobacteria bacterium]
MDIEQIRTLVADDTTAVDDLIRQRLQSDVVLINQLGHYIINSGGKRLRPLLVLLSAQALGYTGPHHHALAAIVEFIHTATLLHDDVVDASELRRGQDTANAVWGNEASVLVGDFLYSRAFEMMVEVDNMRVMQILAEATNTIAEGEVLQLLNCHEPDTSEAQYLEVILRKTAKLFEAAAQLGAVLAGSGPETEAVMAAYGVHLGTAFQLIDDALDYSGDQSTMGKQLGDDLAEGKPTLPLIHVMRTGNAAQVETVRKAITEGAREQIGEVTEAIASTGAIAYTSRLAKNEALKARAALDALPASAYRDALTSLADYAVSRVS